MSSRGQSHPEHAGGPPVPRGECEKRAESAEVAGPQPPQGARSGVGTGACQAAGSADALDTVYPGPGESPPNPGCPPTSGAELPPPPPPPTPGRAHRHPHTLGDGIGGQGPPSQGAVIGSGSCGRREGRRGCPPCPLPGAVSLTAHLGAGGRSLPHQPTSRDLGELSWGGVGKVGFGGFRALQAVASVGQPPA